MISLDQQRDWAQQLVAASATGLDAAQPDWMGAARDAAVQALNTLPLPDRKQEAWRYTRIDALLKQQFLPAADAPAVPTATLNDCLLPAFDAWRLVFANGRFMPWLSNLHDLPAGAQLCNLREALTTNPEQLAAWFGQSAQHDGHVFTALNTALVNDGVYLHIDSGVELERPIEVIYFNQSADAPLLHQPRSLVVLGSDARATLVERYIGPEPSVYFQNHLTEIVLGAGAVLSHDRLQDESRSAFHLGSVYLSQQQHSHYRGTTLAFGGRWTRTEYHSTFREAGATCELNGLYTVGDQQLNDFHLDVRHTVPDCTSREQFKGVLYGKGRAVFDGRILVEKQAQHSDAVLTNDNLMLSRDAEVDTKPQLEIHADDVKCSHGTTVGQLDPLQVYYLRSRGIDAVAARRMLCLGFAGEVLDTLETEAVRKLAAGRLTEILGTATAVME
ncbi:MAG: Fe-S cluster assembly protein SufD [Gammaproteobacteria bacterium]